MNKEELEKLKEENRQKEKFIDFLKFYLKSDRSGNRLIREAYKSYNKSS